MISIKNSTFVCKNHNSKFSTKFHFSSTTANGIGHAHKLGKESQRPEVTHGTLSSTSPTSHSNAKSIDNIDVAN